MWFAEQQRGYEAYPRESVEVWASQQRCSLYLLKMAATAAAIQLQRVKITL